MLSAQLINLDIKDGTAVGATVDMGMPILEPSRIPVKSGKERFINENVTIGGREYRMTCVSMGNPHAVVYLDDIKSLNLPVIGPEFENNPMFPDRTNTEFIHIINRHELDMRVWERGSGETMACGTGACAAAVSSILNNYTDNEVLVHLLGGDLKIRYDDKEGGSGHVFMAGPAETVFEGSIEVAADEDI